MIAPSRTLPGGIAVLASIAGGLTLRFAFPSPGIWWLAPVGVALTLWALRHRTSRAGFGLGLLAGLAFWLPLIDWIRYFLGTANAGDVGLVLLVALATFMSLWWALGSALIAAVLGRIPPGGARLFLVPVIVAGIWTAREGLSATIPWGGFSWGRVGFSQAGGALDGLFSWVGTAGVTFLVTGLAALVVELLAAVPRGIPGAPDAARRFARLIPATLVALVLVAVPAWQVPTRGSAVVAGVQGDTPSSYADPPEYAGEVLRDQIAETLTLRGRRLDLVVWPEGGSDLDPLENAPAALAWTEVVDRLDAPLLGWAVTRRGDAYSNTSLLWTADGSGARYDKRHPVPFGEYVPARAVFHAIVPGLVDLLQREYTPGARSPTIAVGDGRRAGVFICFDIADDALARQSVADGAQFLLAPSNNTDFGRYSDEGDQQLQIARVRALETGRTVLGVSTVAVTASIRPDGTVERRLPTWRPGTLVTRIPLADGQTPSSRSGALVEFGAGALGIGGWIATLIAFRGPRRGPTGRP